MRRTIFTGLNPDLEKHRWALWFHSQGVQVDSLQLPGGEHVVQEVTTAS